MRGSVAMSQRIAVQVARMFAGPGAPTSARAAT